MLKSRFDSCFRRRAGGRDGRLSAGLPWLIALACVAAGGVGTVAVVGRYGWGGGDEGWLRAIGVWAALAPALLAANLLLRFLRWQVLLRGAGARLPVRASGRIYLASFALNFTPWYLGPTLYRLHAFRALSSAPGLRGRVLGVCIAELLYDAAGLAAVGLIAAAAMGQVTAAWPLALIVAFSAVPWVRRVFSVAFCLLVNGVARLTSRQGVMLPERSFYLVFAPKRYVVALALSLAAWTTPPVLFWTLETASGGDGALAPAARAVAEGTLGGALSAAPGGAGISGTLIRRRAEAGGLAPEAGVIFLYRLGTFWMALGIGAVVWAGAALRRSRAAVDHGEHFRRIAGVYDAQIPEPLRDRLAARKTQVMIERLGREADTADTDRPPPRGLDVGCGHGRHAAAMEGVDGVVVAMDAAVGQAQAAAGRVKRVLAGDAAHLPFNDASFDFLYCINTLHHVGDRQRQERAVSEIRRVLRPGGLFFLHEINTLNPLFRLYMGYIFPVLREIDTGIEQWIRPGAWEGLGSWRPREVAYYTFFPDFMPEWAGRRLRGIEERLERSRWRRFSAHYSAVFERD
jgi:ubiquinone/menaquinone biosynthesis C-methylase UbiE